MLHRLRAKSRIISTLLLISVIVIPLAVSIYIHHPRTTLPVSNPGLKYSDIVYGLFYTIFNPQEDGITEKWYSRGVYESFKKGLYTCPVPYVDYRFEYPPLIGLIWYLSTCYAFSSTSSLDNAVLYHYYVQSAIIGALYIVMVIGLYYLLKEVKGGKGVYTLLLLLVLPSLYIYMIYNWDIVAIAPLVAGLVFMYRERRFLAGLLHGFSVSSKLLTIGVVYYYTVAMTVSGESTKKRDVALYLAGFLVGGVLPYILLYVITPQGFMNFINHHLSWYCENCLYLPLVRDIFSDFHRRMFFSIITFIALSFPLLAPPWRGMERLCEYKYLFLAVASLVLFNYVFSPQMLLLLTPLAMLSLESSLFILYVLADIFNALIILTFFEYPDPQQYGSVTQYMALYRNILLLILYLVLAASILSERLKHEAVREVGEYA